MTVFWGKIRAHHKKEVLSIPKLTRETIFLEFGKPPDWGSNKLLFLQNP